MKEQGRTAHMATNFQVAFASKELRDAFDRGITTMCDNGGCAGILVSCGASCRERHITTGAPTTSTGRRGEAEIGRGRPRGAVAHR